MSGRILRSLHVDGTKQLGDISQYLNSNHELEVDCSNTGAVQLVAGETTFFLREGRQVLLFAESHGERLVASLQGAAEGSIHIFNPASR